MRAEIPFAEVGIKQNDGNVSLVKRAISEKSTKAAGAELYTLSLHRAEHGRSGETEMNCYKLSGKWFDIRCMCATFRIATLIIRCAGSGAFFTS
jgi:hypothetical protein